MLNPTPYLQVSRNFFSTHNAEPIVHDRPEVQELRGAKDGNALQIQSSETWCQALANHIAKGSDEKAGPTLGENRPLLQLSVVGIPNSRATAAEVCSAARLKLRQSGGSAATNQRRRLHASHSPAIRDCLRACCGRQREGSRGCS